LVVVSFNSDRNVNEEWIESVIDECYLDRVEFYADPDRLLYRDLGFAWSMKPQLLDIGVVKMYAGIHKSKSRSPLAFKSTEGPSGADEDYRFRRFVENDTVLQQGGDAVLDKDGKLLHIFPMKRHRDRPAIEDVLSI